MQRERRYISPKGLVLRAADGKKPTMICGHAAVFNSMSEDLGGFRETIDPGFFRSSILPENLDCYSLFNHDPNEVLGHTSNGEVRVSEDKQGLYQETDLTGDTSTSSNMMAHVTAGRINKMSFAFTITPGGETWESNGAMNIRRLSPDGCARLWDVSPVTYPAYQNTDLGVRSLLAQEVDMERIMTALVRCERDLPATKDDVACLKEFNKRILQWCERQTEPSSEGLALAKAKERIARLMAS